MGDVLYETLKQEFTRGSFREVMKDNIPSVCCNCGSTENITYHHIVPLFRGGTNKLTNIAPLCNRCHKAVHMGKHLSQYKNHSHQGRPKKWLLTPEGEEVMWLWAKGEIGGKKLRELLGMTHGVHIKETPLYRDFIKKHGIESVNNTYDQTVRSMKRASMGKASKIVYCDGRVDRYYQRNGVIVEKKTGFGDPDEPDYRHGYGYSF